MRPKSDLIRIWTEALVPVCNHSQSHASQELKWLMLHAKEQARSLDNNNNQSSSSSSSQAIGMAVSRYATTLSDREIELMKSYVDQRVQARKPLQYILGTQPFMELEILTRPPTLIPRWETEEWTGRLASLLNRTSPSLFSLSSKFKVLDICTGSGCIPLGLASQLPSESSSLIGIDIHPKAVQLATDNEVKNHSLLKNNKVQFREADLLAPDAVATFQRWSIEMEEASGFGMGYNLITSNPPYISPSEYHELEPEVSQWEDPKALLADQDGLVFYPRIANMAIDLLARREYRNGPEVDKVAIPELVFEIGGGHQVDFVTAAMRSAGFSRVQVWKDLADKARCIVGAR